MGHRALRAARGQWLVRGKDGRLTAYALGAEGVLRWTETRPAGTTWTGPELLPVHGLTDLSVVQGQGGFVHLVGRRAVRGGSGESVDLVSATQFQSGRPTTKWHSLGNPHAEREKAARLGIPTPAVSASGMVHVFVRNADGSLVVRREKVGGTWHAWQDFKARPTRDGTAAVTTEAGHVSILAPSDGATLHLSQHEPEGGYQRDQDIPFGHTPGTAAGLETAPGRATYYWADDATGGIVAYRPGTWAIPLGGSSSPDPVAVLRAPLDGYDCTVLAYRALDGQIMLTACGTENEGGGVWWSPTGEHCVGGPTLACDAYGRVVLALVDENGALRIARQNREPGLALDPSVRV
ncbi:hypothetical protein AB0M10_00135 [Streptomyces sp. NPDC051840]|uniref:hypothetical protein n=1 Tax=Streptomyces sp. NPDC051840 TaxID=3154752 RepID=UPI003428DAB6